jgi:hypothetical protein
MVLLILYCYASDISAVPRATRRKENRRYSKCRRQIHWTNALVGMLVVHIVQCITANIMGQRGSVTINDAQSIKH